MLREDSVVTCLTFLEVLFLRVETLYELMRRRPNEVPSEENAGDAPFVAKFIAL